MLNGESCMRLFAYITRTACALEIACESRKQTLYRLNRPLVFRCLNHNGAVSYGLIAYCTLADLKLHTRLK